MIYDGSRYENDDLFLAPIPNTDVQQVAVMHQSPIRRKKRADNVFKHYVWCEGDRLDLLAARFLANPHLWWQIAEANPQVDHESNLLPGARLRIPVRVR